jgi:hypothetical protein
MVVVSGSESYFLSYHYAAGTAQSRFTSLLDGTADAAGVHYASRARMTSWRLQVDVADGNDANGVSKWVDSSVEYVCRPDDMLVIWRFRPSADIVVNNHYVAMWTAYAQDEDGTACDTSPVGQQWPSVVTGRPLFTEASLPTYSYPPRTDRAGTVIKLALGPACASPYINPVVVTSSPPGNGDFIRVAENSSMTGSIIRWQWLNLGVPGSGSGSDADPHIVEWDNLNAWNETHDGTLGFGTGRGPYADPKDFKTLRGGLWYQAAMALSTQF